MQWPHCAPPPHGGHISLLDIASFLPEDHAPRQIPQLKIPEPQQNTYTIRRQRTAALFFHFIYFCIMRERLYYINARLYIHIYRHKCLPISERPKIRIE